MLSFSIFLFFLPLYVCVSLFLIVQSVDAIQAVPSFRSSCAVQSCVFLHQHIHVMNIGSSVVKMLDCKVVGSNPSTYRRPLVVALSKRLNPAQLLSCTDEINRSHFG